MSRPSILLAQDELRDTGKNAVDVIGDSLRTNLDVLTRPDTLGPMLEKIHLVWAAIFIVVGIACVLSGYRWHKIVVVILAAMAGVWAGTVMGPVVGDRTIVAVCLSVLFAVMAWPLLRYAVAIFGGLAGAFAGANLWTALDFPSDQHRVGAVLGMIMVGMLAFLAFRAVVIVMTAVGGASLLVFGALAALMHIDGVDASLMRAMEGNHRLVPTIAASAAMVSAVIQFSGGFKGMASLANKADPKAAAAAAKKPA